MYWFTLCVKNQTQVAILSLQLSLTSFWYQATGFYIISITEILTLKICYCSWNVLDLYSFSSSMIRLMAGSFRCANDPVQGTSSPVHSANFDSNSRSSRSSPAVTVSLSGTMDSTTPISHPLWICPCLRPDFTIPYCEFDPRIRTLPLNFVSNNAKDVSFVDTNRKKKSYWSS